MKLHYVFFINLIEFHSLALVGIEPYFKESIKLFRYGIPLQLIELLLTD